MKNYFKVLLIFWTVIMIWYGNLVPTLASNNPMIPYLIVTFILANFSTCMGYLMFEVLWSLIKRW